MQRCGPPGIEFESNALMDLNNRSVVVLCVSQVKEICL